MDEQNLFGYVISGVAVVTTSLAGAVGLLFKLNESKNAKAIAILEERADDCESDRSELKTQLADVRRELATMRSNA